MAPHILFDSIQIKCVGDEIAIRMLYVRFLSFPNTFAPDHVYVLNEAPVEAKAISEATVPPVEIGYSFGDPNQASYKSCL